MLIEAHFSTNLTCTGIFSENPFFLLGYIDFPIHLSYKTGHFGGYIKFHNILSVKSIILFGLL